MVFGKVKGALFRAFKRGHPDVYEVLQKYCDERGLNISDVVASAVASWLAADENAKSELEEAMASRRMGSRSGSTDVRATLEVFKEVCNAMGEMFKAMNEARAGMSVQSMLSDFKAVSTTIEEMRKAASESGKGSIEDLLVSALLSKIVGGPATEVKTGTGKVKQVEG